mgnify:CR=1 FL=1
MDPTHHVHCNNDIRCSRNISTKTISNLILSLSTPLVRLRPTSLSHTLPPTHYMLAVTAKTKEWRSRCYYMDIACNWELEPVWRRLTMRSSDQDFNMGHVAKGFVCCSIWNLMNWLNNIYMLHQQKLMLGAWRGELCTSVKQTWACWRSAILLWV